MTKKEREDGFGDQFDAGRFADGQADEETIIESLGEVFNAHHVAAVETEDTYDNFAEDKPIHQLIDYAGIDYVVDPFHEPVFGVNHRTHSPSDVTLRLDLRADTGTSAPAELEKLRHADHWDIVPKYASRLKQGDDGVEWFRIVQLQPLVDAIETGLRPHQEWTDGDVTAWMFDYSLLRDMDLMVAEIEP